MVPNGWELKELKELVTFSNGKGHEKHISETGKYAVVNSKFISSDGRVVKFSDEVFCPACKDDILMVMSDVPNGKAIAKCFLVNENEKYTVNQRIARFTSKGSEPLFLFYTINRNSYYLQFDDGLKQTNLRKDDVLACPIKTPPLSEQRKIAKILSTWDKAISTTERLIDNSKQQKKALMQQLLTGKKRLIDDSGKPFEGEWEEIRQGDVATFHNGRAYKKTEWEEKGTPVIRLQNLTGRGTEFYYSTLELPEHQYCTKGDLLYMWSATFGPAIWKGDKAIYHYHIWKVSCKPNQLSKPFMFYMLDYETQRWMSQSNGMGLLHITKTTMEKQLIGLPSIGEQQKIALTLTVADQEIELLEQQLADLKQEKKALMQQLLTGKRRVKLDDKEVA